MNEAANFCDGECILPTPTLQKHQSVKNIFKQKEETPKTSKNSIYDDLPYTPGGRPLK